MKDKTLRRKENPKLFVDNKQDILTGPVSMINYRVTHTSRPGVSLRPGVTKMLTSNLIGEYELVVLCMGNLARLSPNERQLPQSRAVHSSYNPKRRRYFHRNVPGQRVFFPAVVGSLKGRPDYK